MVNMTYSHIEPQKAGIQLFPWKGQWCQQQVRIDKDVSYTRNWVAILHQKEMPISQDGLLKTTAHHAMYKIVQMQDFLLFFHGKSIVVNCQQQLAAGCAMFYTV